MKYRSRSVCALLTAMLFLGLTASTLANVYVKRDSPGPIYDGASWDTAFHTVQAGLDASASGDEVWVARGTYVECITLKDGVGVYGGFAGDEALLSQRPAYPRPNPDLNEAILDGNRSGSVVTCPAGATTSTRIDGFTIRNGSATDGGGIYCGFSSPTIIDNAITENSASHRGGGVYCMGSSATIAKNLIAQNIGGYYGGGLCCNESSVIIENNTFKANEGRIRGGGIYCSKVTSATIRNNSIAGNISTSGGGILCDSSSPTITNNTIIQNTATAPDASGGGIACDYSSSPTISNNIIAFNFCGIHARGGSPKLRNNCLYGNKHDNYSGVVPGAGDISLDPLLAGQEYGGYHIQPESPCVNAGWSDAPGVSAVDIDGQPRVQGGSVDIGADESDGTAQASGPLVIVRVSPEGDDASDGDSWAHAKRTVQAGMDAASLAGGDVWVKAGIYKERVEVPPFAHVYGGFAGTESSRSERNWAVNGSILDADGSGSVVIAWAGVRASTIDGFTIRNGRACRGAGLYCYVGSPNVRNNTITGNYASYDGGGIYCYRSFALVTNNTIANNTASNAGGGAGCYHYSWQTMCGNIFTGNSAAAGGGISCYSATPVSNNTVVGNSAYAGGGILCSPGSQVSNNIVAFNSSGVYKNLYEDGTPILRNNCVYGNTTYDYRYVSAGSDDMSADPLFVDKAGGDYHLSLFSPCVNAGWNDAPGLPETDMDGDDRILYGTVDIGADECSGTAAVLKEAKMVANSIPVLLTDAVVTASFDGFFYIEAEDRSCGIRVEKAEHGVQAGDKVNVAGVLKTNTDGERFIEAETVEVTGAGIIAPLHINARALGGGDWFYNPSTGALKTNAEGERYIEASSVEKTGSGSIAPLHINTRALGGGDWFYNPTTGAGQRGVVDGLGLNNIGLLVTTWGKLEYLNGSYSLGKTAKILMEGMGLAGEDTYVRITGVVSCYRDADGLHPTILPTEITPLR